MYNSAPGLLTYITEYINIMPVSARPKTQIIATRVSDELRESFVQKASKFDAPSTVLRQLIEAFVENRLIISPPATKGTIFHDRAKN